MKHKVGQRGFKYMDPIGGQYGGEIHVYESSCVEPQVWVNITCNDGTILLSLNDAKRLKKQLKWLIRNHWSNG